MRAAWSVWALRAGRSRMDQSLATYLDGMGKALTIPHTMFLLSGSRVVLVDTSFESAQAVRDAYPQEVWRDPDEEPLALLAGLGVAPEQVEIVVCSHLHYDHCGSNRQFSQARVVVQRTELEYALHPTATIMEREFFSPSGGFRPPFDPTHMDLIDGDSQLLEGLSLLHLPGHTPGSQGVVIATDQGPLGLLGDNVMVAENWASNVPVGLHTDLDAWYRSMAKARAVVERVVPSHDMRVFAGGQPVVRIA